MLGFTETQSRTLHLTWIAFFLTFVAWFNMAPFNTTIMHQLGLREAEMNILMICNIALTIPARIAIGSLTDQYGPKKVFSCLLLFAGLVCFAFSMSQNFESLLINRLLMGIVGGGFVVGIKMIAGWFPNNKMGIAQGIYAGWGNFGAAVAAFSLPLIAIPFSIEIGWRMATTFSGILCIIWAFVYFRFCSDIPEKKQDYKTDSHGIIEVHSKKDLLLQSILLFPIYAALMLFVWKLTGHPLNLISVLMSWVLIAGLSGVFINNLIQCWKFNLPRIENLEAKNKTYPFSQIAILSLVYSLTFGSELAVVSIFPQFLETTFSISMELAGVLGASYAFMNLVARPSGGWVSDRFGRRRTLSLLVLGGLVSHWLIGEINSNWQLSSAIALSLIGSIFFKAGNGACFAAVPLIHKDLTGKMAGLAGAYGSIGAVCFLTLYSFVSPQKFFKIIAAYAFLVFLLLFFLKPFRETSP
ncbi:MAG: MFS transporter [Nitrospinota bacterium]|nr:MFS transporter [Nitrospinota bacterium]MEC9423847.1 MFS transporter [Nitrospinota bacterium]MEE3253590.1 MFS transporter [Nitrospinota bacterium]